MLKMSAKDGGGGLQIFREHTSWHSMRVGRRKDLGLGREISGQCQSAVPEDAMAALLTDLVTVKMTSCTDIGRVPRDRKEAGPANRPQVRDAMVSSSTGQSAGQAGTGLRGGR